MLYKFSVQINFYGLKSPFVFRCLTVARSRVFFKRDSSQQRLFQLGNGVSEEFERVAEKKMANRGKHTTVLQS